jgi:hypothetical protein
MVISERRRDNSVKNKVFSHEYGVEILISFLGFVEIPSEFFELAWKL